VAWCERHRPRSGWARYAEKFPDRYRFYQQGGWRSAREGQLLREPNCRVCGRPAVAADHIVNRAEGGAGLDPSNLQSLCEQHHQAKTQAESHRGRKRAAELRRRRTERGNVRKEEDGA
jgi:5-methylcytosine-specific restriction endonuclease McrA